MTQKAIRPLYHVEALAREAGYEITYAYDDIVFLKHSEVLVQFSNVDENQLRIYLHRDLDEATASDVSLKLTRGAKGQDFTIIFVGSFTMEQKPDAKDEIELIFFEEA